MISKISLFKKVKFNPRKELSLVVILLASVLISSCNLGKERDSKHVWIDFNDSTSETKSVELDTSKSIKVAIASIISPQETFIQYNNILKYIEEKLNRKVELIQRKTYKEVNTLLKKNEIDLAFICSGAYVHGTDNDALSLLVIPVRNGNRYYQAYLIAHKESEIKGFGDLKNKKFVFSDSLSNTGMLYPLKRLKDLNTTKDVFFSETYFSHAHDYSIELVSRRIVAGASVNSLIYDYIAKYNPEKLSNINKFECSTFDNFTDGYILVDTDITKQTFNVSNATLRLKIKSFDCKNPLLNKDFYSTLQANKSPYIEVELLNVVPMSNSKISSSSSGKFKANVAITLNGKCRFDEIIVSWDKSDNNLFRFIGTKQLLMSDFGIQAPVAALGLIKVHDEILIHFDLYIQAEPKIN